MNKSLRNLIDLGKPRIVLMVLVTSAIGYCLAARDSLSLVTLAVLLIGTTLCSAGSAILNNWIEREYDARMERTRRRATCTGEISPFGALLAGMLGVLSGTALLVLQINLLCGFLALLTAFLYVLVYTPLKRITWLNTLVGAVPGAIPPLGGWAAATGTLSPEAWLLFSLLFLWQMPHFYSIAWMYREDYARGNYQMLSVIDPEGKRIAWQTIAFTMLLIGISCLPTYIGMEGPVYLAGALALGSYFLERSIRFAQTLSMVHARELMRASLVYLPALFVLIVLDAI